MKITSRTLLCLIFAIVSFSYGFAGAMPNLAGEWHTTELQQLSKNHLELAKDNLKEAITTGSASSTIQQNGRFLFITYKYKLSHPIAQEPGKTKLVDQWTEHFICLIGPNNKTIYCSDLNEPSHAIGEIKNGNQIQFIQLEHGIEHGGGVVDAYVLYMNLVKNDGVTS